MKKIILISLLFAGITGQGIAQDQDALPADSLLHGRVIQMGDAVIEQLQPRDSILIADHVRYGIVLEGVEDGTSFAFPEIRKDSSEVLTIISSWQVDTLKVRKQKRGQPKLLDIKAGIVVTAFDEGEYEFPPLAILRLAKSRVVDTLVFNPQRMSVKTIQIDTTAFELHDIKGQIHYPLTFRYVCERLFTAKYGFPYGYVILLGMMLAAMSIYLVVRYRRKSGGETEKRDPAHIVALRKLDRYRGDKLWAAEKQKIFYSGVTDALREYIVARYGIGAMEMTTGEIFDGLKGSDMPEDLYIELKTLFERADFVKFAKYVAGNEENAAVLPLAVRFVTTTYQADIEAQAKEEAEPDGLQENTEKD